MTEKFIPPDNDEMRIAYEAHRKGVCGPAAIATLQETTVKEIVDNWVVPYKGYAPQKEMRQMLEKFGYSVLMKGGHKNPLFPTPETDVAVVRIQWFDENGKPYESFMRATMNTHYVLMKKIEGEWWIFCNTDKWFPHKPNKFTTMGVEGKGYISSYLEVK